MPEASALLKMIFGRLTLESFPIHEPILIATFAVVVLGGIAVVGALTYFRLWGYLWREWFIPAEGRWHSRDVAAIAQARGLTQTAPYFVDADATANPGGFPVGGLTVLRFANNHLVCALTWFALALMLAGAALLVLHNEYRLRRADHG